MDIFLASRTDITAWSSFFRLLGYDLCVPIWEVLDVPQRVSKDPSRLLEISKSFFSRGGEIPLEKELSSDQEVKNYLEARRMIDLGHLYNCFGRIVAYYGEETAACLFKFAEINFVGEISKHWDAWHLLFSKLLKKDLSSAVSLKPDKYETLAEIIKFRFEEESIKNETLKTVFSQICQSYSLNLESERDKLNHLLLYDIRNSEFTSGESFADDCDELNWIFAFDLILPQNCSYKIWKDFNSKCNEEDREELFEFGIKELTAIDRYYDKKLEKLKDFYLTI